MPQCKVEVRISKGVGYRVEDVYRPVFFCLLEKGHSDAHHIGDPRHSEGFEDDE